MSSRGGKEGEVRRHTCLAAAAHNPLFYPPLPVPPTVATFVPY